MIRINNISLPLDYSDKTIENKICKELKIKRSSIIKFNLLKRSIDARRKSDIHFTATVEVELNQDENSILARCKNSKASITKPYNYVLPVSNNFPNSPIIVGFGPAGMFAGLILAQAGAKPIIIERGMDTDTRVKDVETFYKTGILNTSSNIQFGEGGAGTFSDGKLNTGINDIRSRKVLIEFVKHGAPDEILYNAKPHIGTDYLRNVVKNIRKEIIYLGGQIHFNTKFVAIKSKDDKIVGAVVKQNNSENIIETDNIILAIGHSSRDTFKMLFDSKIIMEQKPFSVGVRIEHLRENIDKAQYGKFYNNKRLGSASYKLSTHLNNGRGVYTFCMCPGGEVVGASSEEEMLCINGMSEFSRNMINSNSALLVGVNPKDFNSTHPLAGIEFQRNIEKNAYHLGGGNYIAPVQRVEDFLKGTNSKFFGDVLPSYKIGTNFARMDDIFPEYITNSLKEAIPQLDMRLKGFAHPDAILTGAETRSSSPVRILRNDKYQSVNLRGLYPCGEGAGYAGGIVSAAVDGIKCAEQILSENP